ncbi:MAG: LCP family protein [Actinobacteria bacterium]|nr:LCP family protein [Actinomycetota bacterium]
MTDRVRSVTARHSRPSPTAIAGRGRRVILILGVLIVFLLGAAGIAAYQLSNALGDQVPRVPDVFAPLPANDRPAQQTSTTFLIVGTDSRSPEPTTGTDAAAGVDAGSQRGDVIMLASLAPDKSSASVVSIPRDSWVDIPGRGKNKVNAAYAFGGASLLTATVEQLTGVRVDHFAVIDFAGFQAMVDAVGGIDVKVAQTTSDRGVTFRQGPNHLDGADALVYVRQRHGLPNGDLDRAHREQNALKALLSKASSSGALSNPLALNSLLDATVRAVSVDDSLTNSGLRGLALTVAALRHSGVIFLNAPISGFGREGAQAVDYLDTVRSGTLWTAFRNGTASEYAAIYPSDKLSDTPA